MGEGSNYRDDVFSREVRAGKRKYFFDVKTTRGNDLFMTITESKRAGFSDGGQASYEKHKIFLYKEDFDKFIEGLQDTIDHIRGLQESGNYRSMETEVNEAPVEHIPMAASDNNQENAASSDISFEDL